MCLSTLYIARKYNHTNLPRSHSSTVALSFGYGQPSLRLSAVSTETSLYPYGCRYSPLLITVCATCTSLWIRRPRRTENFRKVFLGVTDSDRRSLRFCSWISSSESFNGVIGRAEVFSGRFQRFLENLNRSSRHLFDDFQSPYVARYLEKWCATADRFPVLKLSHSNSIHMA